MPVPIMCATCYLTFVGSEAEARLAWVQCPDCAAYDERERIRRSREASRKAWRRG